MVALVIPSRVDGEESGASTSGSLASLGMTVLLRDDKLLEAPVSRRAELVARLPVRFVWRVRRLPSEPESELSHLHCRRPVPARIELIAWLVVVIRSIVIAQLLAELRGLADEVVALADGERRDADFAETEMIG